MARVERLLRDFVVVGIVGARQVGKSTLARELAASFGGPLHHFDLEDPQDRARLSDPGLALRGLDGLVVLDEVQHRPDLFALLRVLADRPGAPARFLVLGSASPELLRQGSESLAGRIAYHRLPELDVEEVGVDRLDELWIRGGFPRSLLSADDTASAEWRRQFTSTFLARDLPAFGVHVPPSTLQRFWTMLAHAHGQIWNASDFGRSFGVADTTVRGYVDLLTSMYLVRQLAPWHANIKKRQVKSPKVYLEDSGILHALLGLETRHDIERHPKLGSSWEGFAIKQVVARLGARDDECFFWATHAGAELDLLVIRGNRRLGFELKRTEVPSTTRSMHIALADLELQRLDVVHAGDRTFDLAPSIRALALSRVLRDLEPL